MLRPPSTSVILVLSTTTVQVDPAGRLLFGVSVYDAGVTVNAVGVPLGHSSLNVVPVVLTDSLKLIVICLAGSTAVALFSGSVDVTVGGVSTVMLTVLVAVCAPPVPVLPWSSTSIF